MPGEYEAPVIIDLKAAGLTHSPGKADGCEGRHRVPGEHVAIDLDEAGLVPRHELPDVAAVLQALHEQAHPDGTRWWESCRERGCADADGLASTA